MSAPRLRVLLVLFTVAAIEARGEAGGDRDEAKRLRDVGTAALERGDAVGALASFEAAHRMFPSPNLRYNCGLALTRIGGREAEAAQAFADFLERSTDAPATARAHADEELGRLRSRLGRIEIVTTVDGAEVTIDGRRRGETPVGGSWLLPGEHPVSVARAGYVTALTTVLVAAGSDEKVRIELRPVAAAKTAPHTSRPTAALTSAPAPAPPTIPAYRRWWLWTGVGLGLVAVGAAAGVTAGVALTPAPPASGLGRVDVTW